MYSNNNHNKWSAGQLSTIIDSIRSTNNGKCSVRMVAERIGLSNWGTWSLLHESGLHTRLYEESLTQIYERIVADAPTSTIKELYLRHGAAWKNINTFRSSLWQQKVLRFGKKSGIKGRESSKRLQNDYKSNEYDFSTLTLREIGEMYELPKESARAILRRLNIPYLKLPAGHPPKVKA